LSLLPCNYNEVNDRFNSYFADYLAGIYGSYDSFLSQLNNAIAAFVVASKILKCITVTEAPNMQTLFLSKLHPDYAKPSSIVEAIKSYEELEYLLLFELGFERTEAVEGARGGSYRYVYSGAESQTITVDITWDDSYKASLDNIMDFWDDCNDTGEDSESFDPTLDDVGKTGEEIRGFEEGTGVGGTPGGASYEGSGGVSGGGGFVNRYGPEDRFGRRPGGPSPLPSDRPDPLES